MTRCLATIKQPNCLSRTNWNWLTWKWIWRDIHNICRKCELCLGSLAVKSKNHHFVLRHGATFAIFLSSAGFYCISETFEWTSAEIFKENIIYLSGLYWRSSVTDKFNCVFKAWRSSTLCGVQAPGHADLLNLKFADRDFNRFFQFGFLESASCGRATAEFRHCACSNWNEAMSSCCEEDKVLFA